MIIQCEQCETAYRFAPTRLHNLKTGKREADVRCIRCGHIFKVDARSDLGESFLNPEPVSDAPMSTAFTAPPQDEVLAEMSAMLGNKPTNDFSFAAEKNVDIPAQPTAPTTLDDSNEFSIKPLDTTAKPAPENTSTANEFIFEPLQDQNLTPEGTPSKEDEDISQGVLEVSAPAATANVGQKKKTSRLLLFMLLLALLSAGVYIYFFLAHGVTSVTQMISTVEEQVSRIIDPHTEPSGPSIQIENKDNFYISNKHLGSIFVINGTVTNTYEHPQGEIAVIATLYNANGATIKSIKVYCGNPISKEALGAEPLEVFQKHMGNKLGAELSNVSVQPGESIPFSAVFHDLPDNFAEFSISPVPPASEAK